MIRRVFWVSVGVGATVYVLRKFNQASGVAAHFTPSGAAAAVNNLAGALRDLTAEFTTSRAEHEQALLDALTSDSRAPNTDPEEYY